MSNGTTNQNFKRGLVKQVLSGDALVIQGPAVNGPPKELTVYLANAFAPRLARRPQDGSAGTSDEPYAWEAREYLRAKIVGKSVVFVRDYVAISGREHGRVFLGGTGMHDAENITESAVRDGALEVRLGKQIDEAAQKLLDLQEEAKNAKRGRWADDASQKVRDIKWQFDEPRELVEKYKHKPVDAIIEQVRDGSTVRAFLLPSFEYVTVMFSGVKAPTPSTREGRSEEYGEEAKFFVEQRLLQRDVKITLEGVSNQNFIGSVVHPRGNIAEFLLKEGFAKCVEWSLGLVTGGPQKLREAERVAKDQKLRLWKNYVSNVNTSDRKSFQAKVIEVGLGDSLTVQKDDGSEIKVYLASIRPPRRDGSQDQSSGTRLFRPLYDIPYMFETREFLRKKVIGKKVQVNVDYVQPKSEQFPEKICCTILYNNQNLALQLVENGLAKVLRYKQDDDNRAAQYDELLSAESNAEKAKKGLWDTDNENKSSKLRIQELQNDLARSKQYLPYLQRSSRPEGIVEFVSSGSRLRVYVPKETCVITFLLGAINCPRGARIGPGGKPQSESDPFADEAIKFTKSHVLQHDVQIEVESIDKNGAFIGNLFVPNDVGVYRNFAELLLEEGLATVHFTAERSKYYNQFLAAEDVAKKARKNLWKDYVEEVKDNSETQKANEPTERKMNLKKVLVSEVYTDRLHFAAQNYSDGTTIEKVMQDLQRDVHAVATYTPRRNEICACLYAEINLWHRARVESVKNNRADVLYIDFGNRENVPLSALAPLPPQFISQPPLCHEFKLAFVQLPNDKDCATESVAAFKDICQFGQYLELNIEYKAANVDAVSAYYTQQDGEKLDVGKYLVSEGLAMVENRREGRFTTIMNEYHEAEKTARREHLNLWRYGDPSGQDF